MPLDAVLSLAPGPELHSLPLYQPKIVVSMGYALNRFQLNILC